MQQLHGETIMLENRESSKLVKPSFPCYVSDYHSGQRHPVKFWQVLGQGGDDGVWPIIDIDGDLVRARGRYALPTDSVGDVMPPYLDRFRALGEVA